MALPVNRDSAIQLLEDALHLLRESRPGTVLCHWTGSAPFALLFLKFWNDITRPRTGDTVVLIEALGLAALFAWMNCWRAVFAGRLRRQLSGAPDPGWTSLRVWNLIATQSFLGATKLIIGPFAAIITFPLEGVVSFYRYAAVLADHLEPPEVIARSRRFARRSNRQGWLLLPLLLLLQLAVAINVAAALAFLPMLVRMLTGFESAFTRSGEYFILNSLFLMLVLTVSWMAFDPFLQAVYCVRCFRAESLETGEDLRAGLRRLRPAAPALAAVLALLALAPNGVATISPKDLETAVQRTMQSHEYDWRLPPEPGATAQKSWLVAITDRLIGSLRSVFQRIGEAVTRFFRWLIRKLQGVMPEPGEGALPTAGMHRSMYVLLAAGALALGFLLWRYRKVRRRKSQPDMPEPLTTVQLEAEDLTADRLAESQWLELAERCLRDRELRLALRAFYLADLAWLGNREFITIHAGKTNREYEIEMRRRTREVPEAGLDFTVNVAVFERAWYGLHDVTHEEIDEFRRRADRIKAALAPQGVAA